MMAGLQCLGQSVWGEAAAVRTAADRAALKIHAQCPCVGPSEPVVTQNQLVVQRARARMARLIRYGAYQTMELYLSV